MFKPRYTILVNGKSGVIRLEGYKTIQLARYDASMWAREGYQQITIRKEKRRLTENSEYILLAILFASPWLIVAGLGL